MTDAVTATLSRWHGHSDRPVDLEEVQDQVEPALMGGGHAVAARLLADTLRQEALSYLAGRLQTPTAGQMNDQYPTYFADHIAHGGQFGQLDPVLAEFDLDRIGAALDGCRDKQFTFLGLQTLYERYFLHDHGIRYELPQIFFMRVAMGLATREIDREGRAIEFYRL